MDQPGIARPSTAAARREGAGDLETTARALERQGRRWVLWSFLFCPCHLPITLTLLTALLGSTVAGAVLRHNRVAVAVAVTAVWLAGTARGLLLVRRADRCRVPARPQRRA